jgi:hypothetical protein
MPADFRNAQADSVGKQHQHQAQSRDDAQDRRIQRNVQELQPGRPDNGTERKKDTDLRNIGAINETGEKRRDDNHHTHQS